MTIPPSKQPLPAHAQKVFEGKVFDVYQWEQEQYNGTTAIFEKLTRSSTVLVIPVDVDGTVTLVHEEQPGKAPFTGFIGGRVEAGEDPLVAAKRELLEEAGLEAEEWILIDALQPISKIEWSVYTFAARNPKKVAEQSLDAGEKIALTTLSFDELISFLADEASAERDGMLARMAIHALYSQEKKEELRKLLVG